MNRALRFTRVALVVVPTLLLLSACGGGNGRKAEDLASTTAAQGVFAFTTATTPWASVPTSDGDRVPQPACVLGRVQAGLLGHVLSQPPQVPADWSVLGFQQLPESFLVQTDLQSLVEVSRASGQLVPTRCLPR